MAWGRHHAHTDGLHSDIVGAALTHVYTGALHRPGKSCPCQGHCGCGFLLQGTYSGSNLTTWQSSVVWLPPQGEGTAPPLLS